MHPPINPDPYHRIALITGADSGMGKETARALAAMGAHVLLGCRNPQRARAAADDITATTGATTIEVIDLDLASLRSVHAAASRVLDRCGSLDVVVNNAAASLRTRQVTEDGFERHWATNVLGPHLLTWLLLPALRASGAGRVVTISTVAAGGLNLGDTQYRHRRFSGTGAYRASKQAARMLAWSLAERTARGTVTVNCVNPGYVLTDLTANAGPLVKAAVALTRFRAVSAHEGADTAIWAAASPDVGGMTGRFWSGRREIGCRYRDPLSRARLWALVDEQLASAGHPAGTDCC